MGRSFSALKMRYASALFGSSSKLSWENTSSASEPPTAPQLALSAPPGRLPALRLIVWLSIQNPGHSCPALRSLARCRSAPTGWRARCGSDTRSVTSGRVPNADMALRHVRHKSSQRHPEIRISSLCLIGESLSLRHPATGAPCPIRTSDHSLEVAWFVDVFSNQLAEWGANYRLSGPVMQTRTMDCWTACRRSDEGCPVQGGGRADPSHSVVRYGRGTNAGQHHHAWVVFHHAHPPARPPTLLLRLTDLQLGQRRLAGSIVDFPRSVQSHGQTSARLAARPSFLLPTVVKWLKRFASGAKVPSTRSHVI